MIGYLDVLILINSDSYFPKKVRKAMKIKISILPKVNINSPQMAPVLILSFSCSLIASTMPEDSPLNPTSDFIFDFGQVIKKSIKVNNLFVGGEIPL